MVQINLLPPSVKKKQKVKMEFKAIKLGPLIIALGGMMVLIIFLWVVQGVRFNVRTKKLAQLDTKLQSKKANLEKLDSLRKEREHIQRKLTFLKSQVRTEIHWAEYLNRLSNVVPPGIWLKKITLHTKKEGNLIKYDKLDISGSALSVHGEEMINVIGKFMSALKDDEVFSEQLAEVRLVSSKRNKVGSIETMDFSLFYYFQDIR